MQDARRCPASGPRNPGAARDVPLHASPLTEGQRDWELIVEAGHSFHPAPVYAQAWAGHRWREENTDIRREPGDERFGYAALGGSVGRWTWKAAVEGTWGLTPIVEGLPIASETRRLVEIAPTVGWTQGAVALEAGVGIGVSGRNFPEGPILSAGAFVRWQA